MITADAQRLEPGSYVVLYEIDATEIGAGILRFHSYTRVGSIWWQGLEYSPWPVEGRDFAVTSGQPPTPKLKVANLEGSISALCHYYEDMVGARVTRRRTLGKYMDGVNFPNNNLLFESRVIAGGGWSSNGAGNVYTYNRPGPDGLNNATRVVKAASGGGGFFTSANNRHPILAGETFTLSADILSPNLPRIRMVIDNMPNSAITLTAIGPTWSRISYTGTAASNIPGTVIFYPVLADASSWTIEVANVQLERGPVATPFGAKNAGLTINPTADPDEHWPDDIWYVERKVNEDDEAVEFELATAMDFANQFLPRRQIIADHCPFIYRSAECGYAGGPVALVDDTPTANISLDNCGKRQLSCELRFGENEPLSFGGFPAARMMR